MIIHNKEHDMESLQEQFGFDVTYAAMQKQPFMGKRIQKSTGYAYKLELLENGNYISKLLDETLLENNELFETVEAQVNEEMKPVDVIEESVASTEIVNESSPGLRLISKILEQNNVSLDEKDEDRHAYATWQQDAEKKLPGAGNVSFGGKNTIRLHKPNGAVVSSITTNSEQEKLNAIKELNKKKPKGHTISVNGKQVINASTIENINAALKLDESTQFVDEEDLVEYLDSPDFNALDESTKIEIVSIISNTMNENFTEKPSWMDQEDWDEIYAPKLKQKVDGNKTETDTGFVHKGNRGSSEFKADEPKEPGKVGRPAGEYGNYKRHVSAEEVGKNVHSGRALSHEKLMTSLGSLIGQFNLDTHINRAATLPHPMYHDALVKLIVNHIKDNPNHEASQHSRFNGKQGDALDKAARAVAKLAIQNKVKGN